MVDSSSDAHVEKTLQRAVVALAGPESQRQRLATAFLYHVNTLQAKELPTAMRGAFSAFIQRMWSRDIDTLTDDDVSTCIKRLLELYFAFAAADVEFA